MNRPLSWSMRFALALSALFAIGTLSAGSLSYLLLSREMTQRLVDDVRAGADSLARIARAGDRVDLEEQVRARVQSVHDGASLYLFIDADSGQATGSLRPAVAFEGARRLVVGRDVERDLVRDVSRTGDSPEAYRAYGIRTALGWVIVARDEAWVAESGEILLQTTVWALAIALLSSIGLAFWFARRNEGRIDTMGRVLEDVGSGQLQRRIGDPGDDDIAALAGRVDRMLEQLEAGVESIRQVSTDVAHDLRAPLARLRMRLEPLALAPDLPPDKRHEIGSALIDIDGISRTFDGILRLARLQSGSLERRTEPVDLVALASDVAEMLTPTAQDNGQELRLDVPEGPVVVAGDPELLAQALTNLVDNALRHTGDAANVQVAVTRADQAIQLTVSDNGPGIAEPDRRRVLERFVRLDESRSVPGTGLGLSLVDAIARLHGARLQLDDNAPGLRVCLCFPVPA